jgi:integrase
MRNGRQVVEYFGRNKVVGEITAADAADMKVHFAAKGLTPASINRKVAALSKMFTVARENGVIDAAPRLRWNQIAQTRFRYLDDMEERALLAYWERMGYDDLRDLSILLIDTGARCFSEMIPVRWDAFGPGLRSVTFWHTKTNKPRTVPLTKRCQEVLKRRKKSHPTAPFTGFKVEAMRSRWDTMRGALQFEDVTPHTLRHTCCTRLVLGGADVKRVMEWMGHSAIVTTMRYMQIKPTSLEDIVSLLEKPQQIAQVA